MKKVFLFTFCSFILLFALVTEAGVSLANDYESNNYQLNDNDYERKFREVFGLEIIPNELQDLTENYHPNSIEHYGLKLTVQEYEALTKRIDLQKEKLPEVEKYLRENYGSKFNELYIDQKNGGIIKVGFKEEVYDEASLKEALIELYEGENLFEIYQVKYSVEELNNLQEKIDEHYEILLLEGIQLLYTSRNIPQERIEVGVFPYNSHTIKRLEELFNSDMLIVKESSPLENTSRTAYTRPVLGGLVLTNQSRSGSRCTSAFSFIKNGAHNILTAGHCGTVNDSIAQGGSSYFIGGISERRFSGNVDAALISTNSSFTTNNIYRTSTVISSITTVQGRTQDRVGDTVCSSLGISNRVACGTILDTNFSAYYPDATVRNTRTVDFLVEPGDSGSPVFFGSQAIGIISGRNTTGGFSIYGHIDYVIEQFGGSVRTW